jgi:LPS-assembly lipoprotein
MKNSDSLSASAASVFSVLAATLLVGCGFHLEGAGSLPAAAATTYLDSANRHTDFYDSLAEAFRLRGADVVDTPQGARLVLKILDDSYGQRMLSVSARNIPREYEVFYTVTFSIESDGVSVISSESLVATRSYTFNETLVLGKSTEEAVLRQALAQDLARQVLRLIATGRGRVAAIQN